MTDTERSHNWENIMESNNRSFRSEVDSEIIRVSRGKVVVHLRVFLKFVTYSADKLRDNGAPEVPFARHCFATALQDRHISITKR